MMDGLVMIYEDVKTGEVIGWYHISTSWVTRSSSAEYCQGTSILVKKYQVLCSDADFVKADKPRLTIEL